MLNFNSWVSNPLFAIPYPSPCQKPRFFAIVSVSVFVMLFGSLLALVSVRLFAILCKTLCYSLQDSLLFFARLFAILCGNLSWVCGCSSLPLSSRQCTCSNSWLKNEHKKTPWFLTRLSLCLSYVSIHHC